MKAAGFLLVFVGPIIVFALVLAVISWAEQILDPLPTEEHK